MQQIWLCSSSTPGEMLAYEGGGIYSGEQFEGNKSCAKSGIEKWTRHLFGVNQQLSECVFH